MFYRKIPEVANGEDKSGTTAICVLISEKYTIFSNCGDSRGVLSGDGSKPVLVTQVCWFLCSESCILELFEKNLNMPIVTKTMDSIGNLFSKKPIKIVIFANF